MMCALAGWIPELSGSTPAKHYIWLRPQGTSSSRLLHGKKFEAPLCDQRVVGTIGGERSASK